MEKYYKIIIDNQVIAVATSNDFKCAIRENRLMRCSAEQGQFLYVNNKLYHADWMCAVIYNISYTFANIIIIGKEEYDLLYNTLYINNETVEISTEQYVYEAPVFNLPEYPNIEAEKLLELVKTKKIKELSYACNQTIENGIEVQMLDGKIHHFSLTTQDQLNLISLQAMMEQGMEQIPYHADGELCKFYTPVEIQMIIAEATRFKTYHTTYYNALKNYVNSLDDPYVITDIQYGVELPEEYQSDVLKTLL